MWGNFNNKNPSKLGGGVPGGQPKGGLLGGGGGSTGGSGMTGSSARGTDRFVLRQAFGNRRIPNAPASLAATSGLTPFRKTMTAGDLNMTKNQAGNIKYGASNQVNNIRRASNAGWGPLAGGVKDGEAAFTGNPTYVYDSSDYVRFKKLQAKNRNYDDKSFGGDKNFAAQVVLGRVRH